MVPSLTDQPDQPLSRLHPDSGLLPGEAGKGGGEASAVRDGAPHKSGIHSPLLAEAQHQVSGVFCKEAVWEGPRAQGPALPGE